MTYAELTALLRRRRMDLERTQKDIAERLGRSPESVSLLETGQREATFLTLQEWAASLGLRVDLVVHEEGEASEESPSEAISLIMAIWQDGTPEDREDITRFLRRCSMTTRKH